MLYNIYNYLKQYIQTAIPSLKRIDWYNDQLTNGVVIVSPSVFIEFPGQLQTQTLSKEKQAVLLTVRIHLVSKILGHKDQSFDDMLLRQHFELNKQLWQILQGQSGIAEDGTQLFTSMDRIAIEHIQYLHGWFVTMQDFATTGFDYIEKRMTTKPAGNVKISIDG